MRGASFPAARSLRRLADALQLKIEEFAQLIESTLQSAAHPAEGEESR